MIKKRIAWNKGKTKKEFPQLSNSGVKKGNVPWIKGRKHTSQSKKKMSKALKKAWQREGYRQHLIEVHKGMHCSPATEFKKGQIPYNKGKKMSLAQRKKCSEGQKRHFKEHPEALRKFNKMKKGQKAWNKNLTKETDKRILKYAKKGAITKKGIFQGQKNPMYGIPSPHKKRVKYNGKWFRSTWEIAVAKKLDELKIKYQYEPHRFYFKNRTYCPDFWIEDYSLFIEVKGWWREIDKKLIKLFRKMHSYHNLLIIDKKNIKDFLKAKSFEKVIKESF